MEGDVSTQRDTVIQQALTLAFYGSLISVLGALLVISLPAPKPRLYGILISFLGMELAMSMIGDMAALNSSDISWAYMVGGMMTVSVVGPLIINPPSGPNRLAPEDAAALDATKLHNMQQKEFDFDSPTVRKRALIGGILATAVIGFRNLVSGIYIFSLANLGTWRFKFPGILYSLGDMYITLGVAVAVPIYFGTRSKGKTLQAVAVSSLAYPFGHMVATLAIPSWYWVHKLIESVGGMMIVLIFHWMSASSLENAPWHHAMVAGILGFACRAGIIFGMYDLNLVNSQGLRM